MKNSKSLRKWLDGMNLSHPLIIAGPCSAETETQVLDIAHQLKNLMQLFIEQEYGNLEQDQVILKVLEL